MNDIQQITKLDLSFLLGIISARVICTDVIIFLPKTSMKIEISFFMSLKKYKSLLMSNNRDRPGLSALLLSKNKSSFGKSS